MFLEKAVNLQGLEASQERKKSQVYLGLVSVAHSLTLLH